MKRKFNITSLSPSKSVRETKVIPSLSTPGGSCSLKESPRYTGTSMVGIATMHKSNAVPVFSQESAKDISQMRR